MQIRQWRERIHRPPALRFERWYRRWRRMSFSILCRLHRIVEKMRCTHAHTLLRKEEVGMAHLRKGRKVCLQPINFGTETGACDLRQCNAIPARRTLLYISTNECSMPANKHRAGNRTNWTGNQFFVAHSLSTPSSHMPKQMCKC